MNKLISILNLENELNISKDLILKIIYSNSLTEYIYYDDENKIYIYETFKNVYKKYLNNDIIKSNDNEIVAELKKQLEEKENTIKQLQSQIIDFAENAQKLAEMTLQSQMQQNYIKTLEAPKPQGIFKRLFSRKEKNIDDI